MQTGDEKKSIHYHYNKNTNKTIFIGTIYLFMLLHFNKNNMYFFNNKIVMLKGTPTVLVLINHNGISSTKENTTPYLFY